MNVRRLLILGVIVALAGCDGTQTTTQESKPMSSKSITEFKDIEREVRGQNPTAALGYLRSHSKTGRLGSVLSDKLPEGVVIEGAGVVCGLNGRGTKNVPSGQGIQKRLLKSLFQEYKEPGIATKMLGSEDTAAVMVEAVLLPFAADGDKLDVRVQAFDRSVNLEGGILAEAELEEFVEMPRDVKVDPMFTYSGRRASRGVQAYTRGLVSLVPGVKDGKVVGTTAANTGYLAAGAVVLKKHGMTLRLRQPDAYQALLTEYTIGGRFRCEVKAMDDSTVRVSLPDEYTGNWERFIRVVWELDTGPSGDAAAGNVGGLLGQLGSGDAKARERAEYALEGIGNAAQPAMLKAVRSSQGEKRMALLRVLGQLNVREIGSDLLTEARTGNEAERLLATRLLGQIKPPGVEEVLVQLLSDESGPVRAEAVRSMERIQAKSGTVRRVFSEEKNFIMNWASVAGRNEVVIYPGMGVRRIDVFGQMVNVNDGFKAGAGVVEVTVAAGQTQFVFKNRPDMRAVNMSSSDIRVIVAKLDQVGVPINDILALIGEMDRTRSLNARVVWLD